MFAGYMKLLTIKDTRSQAWHSNSLFVLGVFTKQQTHSTTLCLSHMLLHSKCPDDFISSFRVIAYSKPINSRRPKNTGRAESTFLSPLICFLIFMDVHHTTFFPPFWDTEGGMKEGQAVLKP